MSRTLLVLVPLLVVGLAAAVGIAPRRALACTMDPAFNPLRGADAAVLGRFDRLAHDWDRPTAPLDPSVLTLAVEHSLVGGPFPEFIEVHADVPLPNEPTMCPQFDRANLVSRPAVVALYRGADGSWSTNRSGVWFTDEPRESVRADALARLRDGTSSGSGLHPRASAGVSTPGCTQPLFVRGTGWPSRALIDIQLDGGYGVMGWSLDDGSFELPVPRVVLPCDTGGQLTLTVTAPALLDLQPVSFRAAISAPGAPLPPDAGSGVETPAAPGARTMILVLGAGAALIGFVLLAAVASLGEPGSLPRRSRGGSDTHAPD